MNIETHIPDLEAHDAWAFRIAQEAHQAELDALERRQRGALKVWRRERLKARAWRVVGWLLIVASAVAVGMGVIWAAEYL